MTTSSFIHACAVVLQLFAVIWALRLIPLTGKAKAWLAFSAAFTLMGIHRIMELLEHSGLNRYGPAFDNLDNLIALLTSILIMFGVYQIRMIFEERQQDHLKLQQQLDELIRFQKVTIGRELRMKELVEENAKLHNQLPCTKPGGHQS